MFSSSGDLHLSSMALCAIARLLSPGASGNICKYKVETSRHGQQLPVHARILLARSELERAVTFRIVSTTPCLQYTGSCYVATCCTELTASLLPVREQLCGMRACITIHPVRMRCALRPVSMSIAKSRLRGDAVSFVCGQGCRGSKSRP